MTLAAEFQAAEQMTRTIARAQAGFHRAEFASILAAREGTPDAKVLRGMRARGVIHCVECAPLALSRGPWCCECGAKANNFESLGRRHARCSPVSKFVAMDAMHDWVEPLRDSISPRGRRKIAECDLCTAEVTWID